MQELYMRKILVINFGSTSTKLSIFHDEIEHKETTIRHYAEELNKYSIVNSQREFRKNAILEWLDELNEPIQRFDAIAARGGFLRPISSGTYLIEKEMVDDLLSGEYGQHVSNLAGVIAFEMGSEYRIPSYTTDPIVVDEFIPEARFTGNPKLERKSIIHALNQKAVARFAADKINKPYSKCNLVIAHMGGGITVGAHFNGEIIDSNNGVDGDGPFTPERSGSLPAGDLVRLCYSGKYNEAQVLSMINGNGGVKAYLGEIDMRRVEAMIANGDEEAALVYRAMVYQIAKEIGAYSTVSGEKVDAIILTGGLAYSEFLTCQITKKVNFIAPVLVFPGEKESLALALGTIRVLNKKESEKIYKKKSAESKQQIAMLA